MEHNPTIYFGSSDALISDVIRALENPNGATSASIEFARSELGYAILQLASGRAALGGAYKPDDVHTVNAQRLTLRAIAARFVSEKMLRASNSHYGVLGLAESCDSADVSTHFRRLIGLVHPDANPVGYPADAAIQVNLANAQLSDIDRRAAYDESLRAQRFTATAAHAAATQVVKPSSPRTRAKPDTKSSGLRQATARIRSRNTLIWAAGALGVAALFLVTSFVGEPKRTELVVASPNKNVDTAPNNSLSIGAQLPTDQPIQGATAAESMPASTAGTISSREITRPSIASDPALATAAAVHPQTAPSVVVTSPVTSPIAPIAPVTPVTPGRNVAPPLTTVAVVSSATTLPDTPSEPVNRGTSDEFLAAFADAVEGGQADRFARLFGRDVAGRNEVLRGFEQLFQGTQRRQMRYVRIEQFRDKRGRVAFSGQADLALLSQDGAAANHRLFVSGTLVQRDGQVQLASWTSYPLSSQ